MIVRGCNVVIDNIITEFAKNPYYGTHEERNISIIRRSYDR